MAPAVGQIRYDVELTARVDDAGRLGDELLTQLEAGLEGPAVVENTRQQTVNVVATTSGATPVAALQRAQALVEQALKRMGQSRPEFIALQVVEVEEEPLASAG